MGEENRQYVRALLWWIGFLLLGFIFWRFLVPYMVPFVIAGFMAALIDPLVTLGERLRVPRTAATIIGMVVVIGGTLFGIALLVSVLVTEILRLSHQLPSLYVIGQHLVDGLLHRLTIWHQAVSLPSAQSLLNSQITTAYHLTATLLQALLGVLVALPNVALIGVLALVAAFFLIRDKRTLMAVMEWLVPPAMRHRVASLRVEVVRGTLGFIRAQLFLVSVTGICTGVGLWFYGSHYALLLGLVAGVLDFIPFLGATALLGPWALVLFVTGQPINALELVSILAGVALVRNLIEPRLVGGGTGLHPLTALLALYVGIRLFGPIGFIIGPITAVVIKAGARAAGLPPYSV